MSGSHSGSDDSNDSRKRPPDEILYPDSSPKRANCDETVHLKVLIPSIAAGAVIGKSGEAIGKIQKDTNTKVKISKQDEFYPGTTERVCLIIGSVEGVMCVNNYIMDRVMEKPDPNPHATCEGRLNVERHKQVKILVPNSTAGMVIGKGGAYIQEIKDKTGAYVQISQKSREFNLLERCIIIAGDLDQTRAAVQLILAVISADPQSASCPNLSYNDVRGPVASVYPTGSPYATPVVPCPVNSNWLAGSSTDSAAAANTMAMMAAVLSPRSLTPVGTISAVRNAPLGFFPSNYPTASDLTPLTALAASNQALGGLAPLLQATALPGSGDLMGVTPQAPFASSSTPSGLGTSMVDPNLAINVAAQQAALLAATFRPKPQLFTPEVQQQLADPSVLPCNLISPGSVVPGPFRMSSSMILGYPSAGSNAYMGLQAQQGFHLSGRPGQPLVESHPSPPSGASGASSTASSPSTIAASVALAALSAAAGVVGSTPAASMLPNPGAILGMVHPATASTTLNVHQVASPVSRPDPLSLTFSTLPPTSPSLYLTLSENTQGTSAPVSSPTAAVVSQPSVLGLYAVQNTSSSPTAAGSVAPFGGYLCRRIIPIPENLIGLILGPQGRSIIDLQAASGTTIQISQKGVYVPGTHNRMVTITGPPLNVHWITSVIEQRVAIEQLRRESVSSGQPSASPLGFPTESDEQQYKASNFFHLPITSAGLFVGSSIHTPVSASTTSDARSQGTVDALGRKLDPDPSVYQSQPP